MPEIALKSAPGMLIQTGTAKQPAWQSAVQVLYSHKSQV